MGISWRQDVLGKRSELFSEFVASGYPLCVLRLGRGSNWMGKIVTKGKVSYLLNAFPKLSETFILNEIWELKKRGVDIFLVAMGRSNEGVLHAKAEAIAHEMTFLDEMSRKRKFENVVLACFLHPFRLFQTIAFIRKRFKKGKRWTLQQALYLSGELIRNDVKHVHAHFAMDAAEKAMLASLCTGISYSMHPHALDIYVRPDMLKDKMRFASFVSTECEFNKKYLLDYFPGYPEQKVVVLRLGIDLDMFTPKENTILETGTKNGLSILSVARLVEKKGMIYLLEAIKRLSEDGVRSKAVIVGEGPEYVRLSTFIVNNRLEGFVDLKGPRTSDYVKSLFAACDLFVLPCIVAKNGDQDATPTAIMEAMAMKIPVISTEVAGIPETISDACGFVIPEKNPVALAEAIKRVAQMSDSERRAMGEAGRTFVEANCNIRIQADKLVELFERC